MSFDVFGDFDAKGYLRNYAAEKDLGIVKRLEHAAFRENLGAALDRLSDYKTQSYAAVLETHKILFSSVYPWAGQDRLATAPEINIVKGGYDRMFAFPNDIRRATEYALKQGNDPQFMRAKPGEVMGSLAHAHPFLDGNGRTIIAVHTVLADRAGFSIDWRQSDKDGYLQELTKELHLPGDGHLDRYLKDFIRPPIARHEALTMLTGMKALGPGSALASDPATDPQLQKRGQRQT